MSETDIVITGEGKIDKQTAYGKAPAGVAKIAKKYNKPVIGISGTVGEGINEVYKVGIDEQFGARPLKRAIEREISTPLARKLLREDIDCANTEVEISAKKGKVIIDAACLAEIDNPPFYMEAGNGDE